MEKQSGIQNSLVSVYAQGAAAVILIQGNCDDSVKLGLSIWQNLFCWEFGGPRNGRRVVCTTVGDKRIENTQGRLWQIANKNVSIGTIATQTSIISK